MKGAVWQGTTRLSDGASLTRFKLGGARWLFLQCDGRPIQAKAKVPLTIYHDALKTIDLIYDDKQDECSHVVICHAFIELITGTLQLVHRG